PPPLPDALPICARGPAGAGSDRLSRPATFGMLSPPVDARGAPGIPDPEDVCMRNKPWLDAYPKGVPAEIDADKYPSLAALVERAFDRYRERPAFTNRGTTLTFGDLDRPSRSGAAYLQAVPGLKKGDRIAVMMPNLLQTAVTVFGVLRAGMVVVNVNPLYTVRELEHQLADSGARVIEIGRASCRERVSDGVGDDEVAIDGR